MGSGIAARKAGGAPGDDEAEHVAEIMAGVGKKRDRVDRYAIAGLNRNEGQIEGDADEESAAEGARGMVVTVRAVRMTAMAMAIMWWAQSR